MIKYRIISKMENTTIYYIPQYRTLFKWKGFQTFYCTRSDGKSLYLDQRFDNLENAREYIRDHEKDSDKLRDQKKKEKAYGIKTHLIE